MYAYNTLWREMNAQVGQYHLETSIVYAQPYTGWQMVKVLSDIDLTPSLPDIIN